MYLPTFCITINWKVYLNFQLNVKKFAVNLKHLAINEMETSCITTLVLLFNYKYNFYFITMQ